MGDYFSSHHPYAEKGIGSEWLVNVDALVDVAGGDGGGVGSGKHVTNLSPSVS